MTVPEWISFSMLMVNFVAAIIGLTWGVGRIKEQIKDQLGDEIDELRSAVTLSEHNIEQRTGEMGAALREKVTQVELFIRDNYVRQKDFETMLKMLGDRFDRLQDGLDRLNTKIDKQITGSIGKQ